MVVNKALSTGHSHNRASDQTQLSPNKLFHVVNSFVNGSLKSMLHVVHIVFSKLGNSVKSDVRFKYFEALYFYYL